MQLAGVALMGVLAIVLWMVELTDTAQCAMLIYLFAFAALWKSVLQNSRIGS